jgi:hypothetical protein
LRAQVATELNQLNTLADPKEAAIRYRGLNNDGLRMLASMPGNETAFSQLTIQPLDPDDPANANRAGPDNPSGFAVDPALRAYTDTLDGRSSNRYFYRAAYVDGAHNRSPLGLSGPPVGLPKVVAPRTPTICSVSGGESTVTISWAFNREPELASYRVYRADEEVAARDLRTMTLMHTELVPAGDPATRPAQVTWDDSPVPARTTLWYRLAAVDGTGNVSVPTDPVAARAFRSVPPTPPTWVAAAWDATGTAVHLEWVFLEAGLQPMVQRQRDGSGSWVAASDWLAEDTAVFDDPAPDAATGYRFRVLVRDPSGAVSTSAPAVFIPPFGP